MRLNIRYEKSGKKKKQKKKPAITVMVLWKQY